MQKYFGNPVYNSLCSAPWLFRFTLLELVKGGYRGAKKGRVGGVECKGWNLTIDFLVGVLRQEGTRRVRMGSFQLLGVLCQGYSLGLTGTRGLVDEGGVEGMVYAFRG